MFATLRRDSLMYADCGGWLGHPGFWLMAVHRYGSWAASLPMLVRLPFWLIYRVLHLSFHLFNIELWAGKRGAQIGQGVCLIHPHNIMIGPGTVIGDGCLIHHEVTFGTGAIAGTPKLGNNITVYPGARILGGVRIGDNSMIGANCVIVRHLPEGSIVMPSANRILPRALSPQARKLDANNESSGSSAQS